MEVSGNKKRSEFQLTRLMRGVTAKISDICQRYVISTHTPHARRDFFHVKFVLRYPEFQLTRLMRGVTVKSFLEDLDGNISTHTPHARRDFLP